MHMSRQQKKLLNPHAMRCELYNDGHWCFVYDAENLDLIRELGGYEAMTGEAVSVDAECRLERLADRGLSVAWELGGDDAVVVDVLVDKVLSSGQKQKTQWLEPQYAYLNVPSGRLRIETLNSLAFSPDAPTDAGCEIKIPPGQYDMILHRVNWPLMDADMEGRPELPTEFLVLRTIKKKGPIRKTAHLTYSEALGDDGAWLMEGKLEGSLFSGMTRACVTDTTSVYINLRGSHAEQMDLSFGKTVKLTAGQTTVSVPFIACMSILGIAHYFGRDWRAAHFFPGAPFAGLSLLDGSPPWLLKVEKSGLPVDTKVTARVGKPWCELPDINMDTCQTRKGAITCTVAWVLPSCILLNATWDHILKAKIQFGDVLELRMGTVSRTTYLHCNPKAFLAETREQILTAARPERVELKKKIETVQADDKIPDVYTVLSELQAQLDALVPEPEELDSVPLLLEFVEIYISPERQMLILSPFVCSRHGLELKQGDRLELVLSNV
jgi:hypothetical protein